MRVRNTQDTSARSIQLLAACALVICACGTDGTSPSKDVIPASAAASATHTLRGTVAATLTTPLAVIVKNKAGEPLGGIAVTFQVASGGGTLSVPGVSTDASGRATTSWILGQRSGVQQATATVGNLPPVNFVAVAAAAEPASIVKIAGDAQRRSWAPR